MHVSVGFGELRKQFFIGFGIICRQVHGRSFLRHKCQVISRLNFALPLGGFVSAVDCFEEFFKSEAETFLETLLCGRFGNVGFEGLEVGDSEQV
jgi:hypothetical protein